MRSDSKGLTRYHAEAGVLPNRRGILVPVTAARPVRAGWPTAAALSKCCAPLGSRPRGRSALGPGCGHRRRAIVPSVCVGMPLERHSPKTSRRGDPIPLLPGRAWQQLGASGSWNPEKRLGAGAQRLGLGPRALCSWRRSAGPPRSLGWLAGRASDGVRSLLADQGPHETRGCGSKTLGYGLEI